MRKNKSDNISGLQRYLTNEIGIEFKACLYFFCILFFYSMYRIICGSFDASIIHMAEMILMTYTMGYVQVFLLSNFDEGEQLRVKEGIYIIVCSLIYTVAAYAMGWFDRKTNVSLYFFMYIAFAYVCAFLVYKIKRDIDGKLLNEDLKAFQERKSRDE